MNWHDLDGSLGKTFTMETKQMSCVTVLQNTESKMQSLQRLVLLFTSSHDDRICIYETTIWGNMSNLGKNSSLFLFFFNI